MLSCMAVAADTFQCAGSSDSNAVGSTCWAGLALVTQKLSCRDALQLLCECSASALELFCNAVGRRARSTSPDMGGAASLAPGEHPTLTCNYIWPCRLETIAVKTYGASQEAVPATGGEQLELCTPVWPLHPQRSELHSWRARVTDEPNLPCRRRSKQLPRGRMAQPAWSTCPRRRSRLSCTPRWALPGCPSAWPRPSTPSQPTLLPRCGPCLPPCTFCLEVRGRPIMRLMVDCLCMSTSIRLLWRPSDCLHHCSPVPCCSRDS